MEITTGIFSLDRAGHPLVEPYNIFSYTFATMAFGQLSLATENQEYADIAKKTFDIVLSKSIIRKENGISFIWEQETLKVLLCL